MMKFIKVITRSGLYIFACLLATSVLGQQLALPRPAAAQSAPQIITVNVLTDDYTANNCATGGSCSLRHAIALADTSTQQTNFVILFSPSLQSGTINLSYASTDFGSLSIGTSASPSVKNITVDGGKQIT